MEKSAEMGTGEMETKKWRPRNGNWAAKELETGAKQKWKMALTRNENNCLPACPGHRLELVDASAFMAHGIHSEG